MAVTKNNFVAQTDSGPEASAVPLVTVLMPVRDRLVFLDKAIESVLAQSTPDWRMLITIDTLNPREELIALLRNYADARISWLTVEQFNQCSAINKAVPKIVTPYTFRLDSDDLLEPQAIEIITARIREHPDAAYLYGSLTYVDEANNAVAIPNGPKIKIAEDFSPARLEEWFIAERVIWRNQEFLASGGYAEDLPYGEDYMLAFSMLLFGAKFVPVKEFVYRYRQHHQGSICAALPRDEQRRAIEGVRQRYAALKKSRNISWEGEPPDTIRARTLVPGKAPGPGKPPGQT